MEEALVARLRAAASIISIGATVFWNERSEALPSMTLTVVDDGRRYAHDGAPELDNPMVQIDCWASTYGGAKLLSRAVRDEMESSSTNNGIEFEESFLVSSRDMTPEDLGSGIEVHRISLDFSVWHQPV